MTAFSRILFLLRENTMSLTVNDDRTIRKFGGMDE